MGGGGRDGAVHRERDRLPGRPGLYAEAIDGALAYTGPLGDEIPVPPHDEPRLRSFLALVAWKLDELRPWPPR